MLGDLLLGIDISLYLFYQVLTGYKRGKNANFQSPSKKSFKTELSKRKVGKETSLYCIKDTNREKAP